MSLSKVVEASVGRESVDVLGDIVDIKSVIDLTVVAIISVTAGSAGDSVDGSSVSSSTPGIIVVSETVDVISSLTVVSSAGDIVVSLSLVVSASTFGVVVPSSDGSVEDSFLTVVASTPSVVSVISDSVTGLSLVEGVVDSSSVDVEVLSSLSLAVVVSISLGAVVVSWKMVESLDAVDDLTVVVADGQAAPVQSSGTSGISVVVSLSSGSFVELVSASVDGSVAS